MNVELLAIAFMGIQAFALLSLLVINTRFSAYCLFWKRLAGIVAFKILGFFPKDDSLVVFGAEEGKSFAGNAKYVYLAAMGTPSIRAVWITKNRAVCDSMRAMGYRVHMAHSPAGLWVQLRARCGVYTHGLRKDFCFLPMGGTVAFNLWHGVGPKKSWYLNRQSFSYKVAAMPASIVKTFLTYQVKTNHVSREYAVATSNTVAGYYPATFHVPPERVVNLGQARNDVFYTDAYAKPLLLEKYSGKAIITYLPTHRAYGRSFARERNLGKNINFLELSNLLSRNNAVFLIKQHQFLDASGSDAIHRPGIVDITPHSRELDTQLLLKYTDVLVTDYSSCYVDFLLLGRPIIFYCFDLDEYLESWELNFDYDYVTPGPRVKTSEELLTALERVLQTGGREYDEERRRVRDLFYSPQNQRPVAEKQCEFIRREILGKEENVR